MVEERCGFTIPWLDLDVELLRRYAEGRLDPVPEPLSCIYPPSVLLDVADRDVLCLALGGGQQSAVFGLLGACVTVVDLAEGQLEGDRRAAAHYGYEVTTIHADMRDLSCLAAESFDLIYGTGLTYIPDLRDVYAGVARASRTGGVFRADFGQPASHFVDWDGQAYRVAKPYAERIDRREDGAIEHRHHMDDIFNGLIEAGYAIQGVYEEPHASQPAPDAPAGSWTHHQAYVGGGFAIVGRKM